MIFDKWVRKISKNLIWAIISFLLAILTIRVVLRQSRDISISDLVSAISSSDKLYFILGVVASAMYVWFEGVAICSILKSQDIVKAEAKGLIYSTSDIYFSAITPSATGGQRLRALFFYDARWHSGGDCNRDAYFESYDVYDIDISFGNYFHCG